MKKVFVLLIMLILVGCSSPDVEQARIEEERLNKQISSLKRTELQLKQDIAAAERRVEELRLDAIELSGDEVQYVLIVELKQSHFSLNLMKHAKDAMNAVKFPMIVSKAYYDRVQIGDEILDEFRGGSLLTESSVGSWKIKVVDKQRKAG